MLPRQRNCPREVRRHNRRRAAVDDRAGEILDERVEHRVHLLLGIMVRRCIGHHRGIRLEGDKRLVALIHLGHGKLATAPTSRAHARSRGIPANNLRAIHDNGIEATRREQMTENCGDRGLSARPRNGNELLGGQHLCQRGGTVRHGNAKLPCTAKPWIGLFHRRRNYDSRRRRRHSGPIIGKQADALALQLLQHG